MLEAYFDASERPSGIFSVSGFAFSEAQIKKLDKQWNKLFGEYGGCHMKELVHRQGRYKGRLDVEQSQQLLKSAIHLIKRRFSFGVVVSCDLNEVNAILPTWIDGFQHAYPVCCHLAMTTLGIKIEESGMEDEVAYHFSSGDLHSAAAHRFMSRSDVIPSLKASYRYHSHFFEKSVDIPGLEAADVFAWEWTKYMDDSVKQGNRPMRKSLAGLLGKNGDLDTDRHKLCHLTGAELHKFIDQVKKLGLLEREENNSKQN